MKTCELYSTYRRNLQSRGFGRDSTSPAVPMPSHGRYTSNAANKVNENFKLKKDFQSINHGINFEIEPFNKDSLKQKLRVNLKK